MCENNDLYDASVKFKDDVKDADDDEVIMGENDDLYNVNNNKTNAERNDVKNDTKDGVIMVDNDELYGVNNGIDDAEKSGDANDEIDDAENDDLVMEENTDLYEESNFGENNDVEDQNKDLSNAKHNRHNYVNVRQDF